MNIHVNKTLNSKPLFPTTRVLSSGLSLELTLRNPFCRRLCQVAKICRSVRQSTASQVDRRISRSVGGSFDGCSPVCKTPRNGSTDLGPIGQKRQQPKQAHPRPLSNDRAGRPYTLCSRVFRYSMGFVWRYCYGCCGCC